MSSTSLAKQIESVPAGVYQHFKDNKYRVLACARHSETGEMFVIYHNLSNPGDLQIRPRSMFTESVEKHGSKIPRFTLISADHLPNNATLGSVETNADLL